MNTALMNQVFEKYWLPKTMDFILRKRLCYKHMREFVRENGLTPKKYPKVNSVMLLGLCFKCKKFGIVYYLEGKIK